MPGMTESQGAALSGRDSLRCKVEILDDKKRLC